MTTASELKPAARIYAGSMTVPSRWEHYHPRNGDVIVATPAKAGTTWTQAIVAMLLHQTTDLPRRVKG